MIATSYGKMEIITTTGDKIYTKMYIVPDATGTLLSPDFMCTKLDRQYYLFVHIDSNTTTGEGILKFCNKGQQHCVQLQLKNSMESGTLPSRYNFQQ